MRNKRRRISNKFIIIWKLVSALILFFSCALFFFQNFIIFKRDFGFDTNLPLGSADNPWWNVLFPIVFFCGLAFLVYYVANMIVRFETKQLWKADRMFIIYQIVFTLILLVTIWRWFFINVTNAMIPSIIMIASGILNWFAPKIIDNNNNDF